MQRHRQREQAVRSAALRSLQRAGTRARRAGRAVTLRAITIGDRVADVKRIARAGAFFPRFLSDEGFAWTIAPRLQCSTWTDRFVMLLHSPRSPQLRC